MLRPQIVPFSIDEALQPFEVAGHAAAGLTPALGERDIRDDLRRAAGTDLRDDALGGVVR